MKTGVLLVLLCLTSALGADPLRLATTEQLKPFAPLVQKVLDQAGIEAVIEYVPQVRVIAGLQGGAYDGGFFIAELGLAAVPGMRPVPVVLYRNDYLAIALHPDVRITSLKDLARYSVAVERGNAVQEELVKGLTNVSRTSDQEAEFRMLAGGRVDVAIASRAAFPSLLKAVGITRAYPQEPPLFSQPLYLGLVGKGLDSLEPLTRAFQKAMDDGSWAQGVKAVFSRVNGS